MRDLFYSEREIINSILPERKSGYKKYLDLIENMKVISIGRFGPGNYILGSSPAEFDSSISSTPVFASGVVESNFGDIDITIHEIDDAMIEVQFGKEIKQDDNIIIKSVTSFSEWNPGDKSPLSDANVNEYTIKKNEIILVIDPDNKKLWLHFIQTGVNQLLPVSNFFNELMRVKKIKDETRLQNPSYLFDHLNEFSAKEIVLAFYQYNKYIRKSDITFDDISTQKSEVSKNKFLKFFFRNKN